MYLPPPVPLCRALPALAALLLLSGCEREPVSPAAGADDDTGAEAVSCIDLLPAAVDGSGTGSGAAGDCWLFGVPNETCPLQPRGNLPADCLSGRVIESEDFAPGTGPCVPAMPDWNCPEGWLSAPGYTDGSGNEDVPEGMTQFSICEPPENLGEGWGSLVGDAPEIIEGSGLPDFSAMPTDCPTGAIAIPGDVACRPMGTPCPTEVQRWPQEAVLRAIASDYAGAIIYVAPDGVAGNTGSRTSPLPLGAEAVRAAGGGIVALSLGTFDASVDLEGAALLGSCVIGTRIAPSRVDPDRGAVELVGAAAALVGNLTVSGGQMGIVARAPLEPVPPNHQIRNIIVQGALNRGVLLTERGVSTAEGLKVLGTRPHPVDRTRGRGIQAQDGATLTLRGAWLRENHDIGLFALGTGTTVEAEGLWVESTQPDASDQTGGRGVQAQEGATLTLRVARLQENQEVGLFAVSAGTTVEAEGLWVESTQPKASDQTEGRGIQAQEGATLTLRGAWLRENHDVGLSASGAGTTVEAEGLWVEGTQPQASDQTSGCGLIAGEGALLSLRDVVLRDNRDVGLFALGAGTTVEAEGVWVEGTQPQASDQGSGNGIVAQEGAALSLRGAALRENHEAGLFALGAGTTVRATGLLVADTQPLASDQTGGRGLNAQEGALLSLRDVVLRDNHDVGLFASDQGTSVWVSELLIQGTLPQASDQTFGRGIVAKEGAALSLHAMVLRDNCEVGLQASGEGTSVWADALLVEGTKPAASDQESGNGIIADAGAMLSLRGAALRRNHTTGLSAYDEGTTVWAEGLLVEGTLPKARDQRFGRGIDVGLGAALSLRGAALRNDHDIGLFALGAGTTVEAEGLLVEGTLSQASDQLNGGGIAAQQGAALSLRGAALRRNRSVGLFALGAGTTVWAEGLLVERTLPRTSDRQFGRGIEVNDGAALTLMGASLRDNHEGGLVALGADTTVGAAGLLVEGTLPQASDQRFGRGIGAQEAASLTLRGVVVRKNHNVGLFAGDADTSVEVDGLTLRGTLPDSRGTFGDGLLLRLGASLFGRDLVIWDNARAGLQLADSGTLLAVRGSFIGRNLIGTNLQFSDFTLDDLASCLRGETYWENGLDLGAEALPIPDPLEALESLNAISP